MIHHKIRRKPNGQYCESDEVLWEWLPTLIEQASDRRFLDAGIRRLAEGCVTRAGAEYTKASEACRITGYYVLSEVPSSWGEKRHANAMKWFKRRDILLRALKEITEIEGAPF